MVMSINLVKRVSGKDDSKSYVALEFDLGYKKHLVFLKYEDYQVLFNLTPEQFYNMKVGDMKPLLIAK